MSTLVRVVHVGALLLGLAASAAAQQPARPLSLADVERTALASNPGLRAYRLEVASARADVRTASTRPNPTLNVFGDGIRLKQLALAPNDIQYGGSVLFPLEWGGRRAKRTDVATQLVGVAQLQAADSGRRVLLAARQARADVLAAVARLQIADDIVHNYDQLVTLNRNRLDEKQIAGVELQRAEVARSQAQVQREEAALAVRQAQDALALVLGSPTAPTLADSLMPVTVTLPPLDSLIAEALRNRPDVLAARASAGVADAGVRLADAETHLLPSVGMDLGAQQGVAYAGVAASVALPLFDKNQGGRAKARVRVDQAARSIAAAEALARTEVRIAADEVATRLAALGRYDAGSADGILARARSIRETAAFAYRRGSTSLLELLDAERTYADLARSYIDAAGQFERARAALDAATAADAARLLATTATDAQP